MPQVAVAVAASTLASQAAGAVTAWAIANLGVTSLIGAQLIYGATLGIVGFGVQSIGGSMTSQKGKKKSSPNLGADLQSGLKQVVRLSDDSYKIIYGKARVGGTLAYVESTNSGPDSAGSTQSGDNLFLHMVIIHAGHEVNSFEEIYLDDNLVTLDGNGFVQEAKYKKDGKSYVRIKHHYGTDDQTADTFLVAETTNWTTNHRLRGLAYTYMRLQWNAEIFQSGIPTFNAVIKGKKVYDPRLAALDYGSVAESATSSSDFGSIADAASISVDYGSVTDSVSSAYAWTDNAALIIRDYLSSRDSADLPYGFGATDDEIDDNYTIAAANICDEIITKLDSTTMKRFTINGAVDTAAAPLDSMDNMITALAGAVTYPAGKFRIHAGAYDAPEDDVIDESWLAGDIASTNRISRQDLFNAVQGTFINPNKGWQKDDFPALTSAAYEAQDNDERIFTDIELPYTIDPEAAQRLAKITQRKGREQISVEMQCNYKALKFTVWDNVKLTNATRGWNEKIFKVIGHSFDLRGGVSLKLREENEDSYDWSVSDAEAIESAPDTNLPNPFSVTVPGGVAYNSRAAETVGGDQLYNLVLSWSEHSDAFVREGGYYEIGFKLSADSTWRPSFTVDGGQSSADIGSPSSVNTTYDLRIRAVNTLGAKSNWVTIENAIIGSSGGVGSTLDYGEWVSSPGSSLDYGDWTSTPGTSSDYGYFT
jgi:hypothetical protein